MVMVPKIGSLYPTASIRIKPQLRKQTLVGHDFAYSIAPCIENNSTRTTSLLPELIEFSTHVIVICISRSGP